MSQRTNLIDEKALWMSEVDTHVDLNNVTISSHEETILFA